MTAMVQPTTTPTRALIEIVIPWLSSWLSSWVAGKMEAGSVICEEMSAVVVMVAVASREDGDVNVDIVDVTGSP